MVHLKSRVPHGLNEMVNLICLAGRFVCSQHRGTVHKITYAQLQCFRHEGHSMVKDITVTVCKSGASSPSCNIILYEKQIITLDH